MDIQYSDIFHYQPFQAKFRRSGCYVRRPQLYNPKPRNHISIPLKHIDYDIQITNGLASITLQQRYLNPVDKFLEIDFSFPIDPKACVYKFFAEFGNKRIQGIVKEKEQAKRQYQQAVKQGKQAVYAEVDPNSKDIMNLQIGNLGPKEQVKITISYLMELTIEQNTFYQFHLASTISPRYMSNIIGKRVDMVQTQQVRGQYTWSFKVSLLTSQPIVFQSCKSHKLQLVSTNENSTQMILVLGSAQKPNRDFTLLFSTQNFHLPSSVLGRTDNTTSIMLSFIPKYCQLDVNDAFKASMNGKELETDVNAAKGEYIFLLDRSGSMGGTRIQRAKEALIIFLQSLPSDTYFNVVSFGSSSESMFTKSQKYNKENLDKAFNKIKAMSADMGGTQIYKPLVKIFENKTIQGYPKQIFLLTDGDVSDTQSVIKLVQKQTKYSRCHSIGIGNGCSQALIKGCAEKGKGKFIFIQDSQNPSDKIIGLLQQTMTPVISKIELKFDQSLVTSIVPNPSSIPYILKNQVVNFYITLKSHLQQATQFKLSYTDSLNNLPYSSSLSISPSSQNMPFIDKMAHNLIIKNLQSAYHDNGIKIQQLMYYVKIVDKKKQAIQQSVKSQVLSEFTAFICVEKELVDGKYQEVQDKGKEKINISPIQPQDNQEYLQQIMEKAQQLQASKKSFNRSGNYGSMSKSIKSTPLKMALNESSKKSSGFGFPNILSSVANGISNLFGKSYESVPMMAMAPPTQVRAQKRQQLQKMKQRSLSRCKQVEKISQKMEMKCAEQNSSLKNYDQAKFASNQNDIQYMDQIMQIPIKQCVQMKCEMKQQNVDQQDQVMLELQQEQEDVKKEKKDKKDKKKKKSSQNQYDNKPAQKQIPKQKSISLEIKQLISLQNIDGSFTLQSLLTSLYSTQILQKLKSTSIQHKIDLTFIITYLVSKWIELNHPQKQYALIVKKAISFVKKGCGIKELEWVHQIVN